VRYDLEFWPEQTAAVDALLLAERVFAIVAGVLPATHRSHLPAPDR
jgi:hypothetical protein